MLRTMLALVCFVALAALGGVQGGRPGAARLVCYVESSGALAQGAELCTHVVYAGVARGDKMEAILKEYKKNQQLKVILRVNEDDKDLKSILKSKYVHGLEVYNAHRSLNKTKVTELVEDAHAALSTIGGGPLFVSLPANPELLAKYYDLRALVKFADVLVAQTHALGVVKKMAYHPSRLSGMWDMMNTDSVVDLVVGLGGPASKIIITLPATSYQFRLTNETLSTPGSPTMDDEPKELSRKELCEQLGQGKWMMERDQDLSAPYAFKKSDWISFEDASSVDVKGKYARVRGLAGLALARADSDAETSCGPSLLAAMNKVLNSQKRAPRGAVLRSLESEILSSVALPRVLDELQVSPYRITQVVDSDGVIHSVREDTRTEFTCSRQGYFVHPRTCARFYRCVKFDQLSPDYTVFEFDCPAGLAFDSRYEVCVWPGSLPDSQACPGSSEIAPVPQTRFVCPEHEGYYADPENCRWFFACMDHGKAPLSAYEFRCPFGLGFDASRLLCDWPWLVPACGNIARYEAEAFGYSGAALTGFHGQSADSVNIAAHQSLVSGAALTNLVGVQGGFLSKDDALSGNYIAAEEYSQNAGSNSYINFAPNYDNGNSALNYNDYSSAEVTGSLIKDAYIQKPVLGFVNTAKYDHGNAQYAKNVEFTGSSVKDAYIENKPVGFINAAAHGTGNAQSINIAHGNAGTYYGAVSKDVQDAYIENKPVDFVNAVTHGTGSAQNINIAHGNAGAYYGAASKDVKDAYIENRPVGFINAVSHGTAKDQNINIAHGNAGAYYGDTSKDTEITGSLIKDTYIAKTPVTTYVDVGSNQENSNYVDHNIQLTNAHLYSAGPRSQYINYGAQQYLESNVNTGEVLGHNINLNQHSYLNSNAAKNAYLSPSVSREKTVGLKYKSVESRDGESGGQYYEDHSGAYVHDSTGDRYEQYKHVDSETVPYVHDSSSSSYKQGSDEYKYANVYKASANSGLYRGELDGKYALYNSAVYKQSTNAYQSDYAGAYVQDYLGSYKNDESGQYVAGIYRPNYNSVSYKLNDGSSAQSGRLAQENSLYKNNYNSENYANQNQGYANSNSYQNTQTSQYLTDSKAYTGTPHSLTAGAVNVGLVGKTTLIHTDLENQYGNNNAVSHSGTSSVSRTQTYNIVKSEPFSYVHQPSVSVSNVGSDSIGQNLNEYDYNHVTTLSSVGVVPTATPFAVTTSIPVSTTYSYKPTFAPVQPKSDIREVFGYSKPTVTFVQPTVSVYTAKPQIVQHTQPTQITNYNQGFSSHEAQNNERGDIYVNTGNTEANNGYVSVQTKNDAKFRGYDYSKPSINFEEVPFKKAIAYTTGQPTLQTYVQPIASTYVQPKLQTYLQPIVSTTSRPQVYSSQTVHKVEPSFVQSTAYENPLTKYVQDVKSVTPAQTVVTHYQPSVATYVEPAEKYVQPLIHKHEVQHIISKPIQYELPTVKQTYKYEPAIQTQQTYAYGPEIQRNLEDANIAISSYKPSAVSHQVHHQSSANSHYHAYENNNQNTFVSSTPSNIIYEDHYEYKAPVGNQDYKQEYVENKQYVVPKQQYVESYASVSSTQAPIVRKQQQSVVHTPQVNYEYKSQNYINTVEIPKQSFSYESNPQNFAESIHISSSAQEKSSTYKPVTYKSAYENQAFYKAEEYLPPVVSTPKTNDYLLPVVTQNYLPPTPSTTVAPEYLPALSKSIEYLPPKDENTYIPVTTPKHVYKSTTQIPTYTYKSSTPVYKAPEYLPPGEDLGEELDQYYENYGLKETIGTTRAPVSIKYNPFQKYAYENVAVTPVVSTTSIPINRKQNIVVQNAKAQYNLLGFGTVGPDAGLVGSPYYSTTAYPEVTIPVTQRYTPRARVGTSTYAPIKQEIVQVAPSPVPIRKTRPKIAVVTKINDFNPLLVRKLGAVCSCQSPVLVLRGKKPNLSPNIEFDGDYGNDYDGSYNDDNIDDSQWSQKSQSYKAPALSNSYLPASPAPVKVVSSTFNPIIVPDDSYYQDYQESAIEDKARYTQVVPKQVYSENFVSSTYSPVSYAPSTETTVRIRPRVKSVTVAPTLKTILIPESVTQAAIIVNDPLPQNGLSQAFDRYGPGGWRNRDETLQGSVDCQRAGLFRHPKHCNKFYACRWDCTKERFTLHIFNCPVQLSFDPSMGACNWPSQGPACQGDTLLTTGL